MSALKQWFAKKLRPTGATTVALSAELALLKRNLDEVERENADDWIKLTTTTLTFSDLEAMSSSLGRKPIVFLNMCHSAQINPGLSTGFVGYFLQRGACAVIGTECPIPTFFAEAFAKALFDALATGKSLGDAVYEARRLTSEGENPLALAYSLYGNMHVRLVPAPAVC